WMPSAASGSILSTRRAPAYTRKPWPLSALAASNPIPVDAPVMNATGLGTWDSLAGRTTRWPENTNGRQLPEYPRKCRPQGDAVGGGLVRVHCFDFRLVLAPEGV